LNIAITKILLALYLLIIVKLCILIHRLKYLNPLISDVNDIAPQFSAASYSFDLDENISIGTSIGAAQALDEDLSLAGLLSSKFHLCQHVSNCIR